MIRTLAGKLDLIERLQNRRLAHAFIHLAGPPRRW